MSREVLRAIGIGERTFTNIARAAGGIAHTLTRATDVLTGKRVVAAELPLSLRPSKERRCRVADPHLRFWLAFPLVRESLARLLPDGRLLAAPAVGGYWTRSNDVEIDLVGADRQSAAKELLFLGSAKRLENSVCTAGQDVLVRGSPDRCPDLPGHLLRRWSGTWKYRARILAAPPGSHPVIWSMTRSGTPSSINTVPAV